jgi:hypothetical protein
MSNVGNIRKRYLALERDCLAIDAKLHAKWGWSDDPEHVKRCKACKSRRQR